MKPEYKLIPNKRADIILIDDKPRLSVKRRLPRKLKKRLKDAMPKHYQHFPLIRMSIYI